jgi:hypothetical protein
MHKGYPHRIQYSELTKKLKNLFISNNEMFFNNLSNDELVKY